MFLRVSNNPRSPWEWSHCFRSLTALAPIRWRLMVQSDGLVDHCSLMLTLGSAFLATFAGQNFGAQNQQELWRLYLSLLWCLGISVCALLAFLLWKEAIMLFSNESSVVEIGYTTFWFSSFLSVQPAICVLNGFLRGVGDTFFPMLVSVVSFGSPFALAYFWSNLSGETGICGPLLPHGP